MNEYAADARDTGYSGWEQNEMFLRVTYEARCNEYLVDNDDEEGEYEYEYDELGEEYIEVTKEYSKSFIRNSIFKQFKWFLGKGGGASSGLKECIDVRNINFTLILRILNS